MDETRRAYRNDTPCGDRPARTYKHYVISPDPGDAVSLDGLRDLAVAWARDNFPDYEVAIVYHDDNCFCQSLSFMCGTVVFQPWQ
jgi:hypothetical protein